MWLSYPVFADNGGFFKTGAKINIGVTLNTIGGREEECAKAEIARLAIHPFSRFVAREIAMRGKEVPTSTQRKRVQEGWAKLVGQAAKTEELHGWTCCSHESMRALWTKWSLLEKEDSIQLLYQNGHHEFLQDRAKIVGALQEKRVIDGERKLLSEADMPCNEPNCSAFTMEERKVFLRTIRTHGRHIRHEVDRVYKIWSSIVENRQDESRLIIGGGDIGRIENLLAKALPRLEKEGFVPVAYLINTKNADLEALPITYTNGSYAALSHRKEDGPNACKAEWKWISYDGGRIIYIIGTRVAIDTMLG